MTSVRPLAASIIFKDLLLGNRFANLSQSVLEGRTNVCSEYLGQMTKMAATPIYTTYGQLTMLQRTENTTYHIL